MKRYFLFLILAITALLAFAVPPKLACEQVFAREDLRKQGYKIVCNKSKENYYRSITAKSDKKLLSEVKKMVDKDKERAFNVYERCLDGKPCIILNILSNGHTINVGFWWTDEGYVNLFVQSELAAFE